jgi:hypothetical protein
MMLHRLDPLTDSRWPDFVARHPRSSIFHSRGWLEALQRTYGYRPLALSPSPPGEPVGAALVFCDVRSWLTGRRLVSLPFSDHCEPLMDDAQLAAACALLEAERRHGGWRYIELRPHTAVMHGESRVDRHGAYWLHLLDLRPSEHELFSAFHRTATQQMIRRAEREGLTCETGRDDRLLQTFHALVSLTRRRHHAAPQPLAWFRHLAATLGDVLTVRVASLRGSPIAGILTLHHRQTMTFKYGASDARFHRLGAMQLLLWKAIQHARAVGCTTMDFGRSERAHTSLAIFKDRWGAVRSDLAYWRVPPSDSAPGWIRRSAENALRFVPTPLLPTVGKYLYKHAA